MQYHVLGIGHAISDLEIEVTDAFLSTLALKKGSMTLIDVAKRDKILSMLPSDKILRKSPGGSVANTLTALAKLGKSCCFLSGLGDDTLGKSYFDAFKSLAIAFPLSLQPAKQSGSCLVFITPDAERTMLTTLGCSGEFTLPPTATTLFANSALFYIEGYLLETPETTQLVDQALQVARAAQLPIALSASNLMTVNRHLAKFKALVQKVDIFFANEDELKAMHGLEPESKLSITELGNALTRENFFLAVSAGAAGSYLWNSQKKPMQAPLHIPAKPTTVIDTTGAGDAYAAGILNGILEKKELQAIGDHATTLASTVISRFGARY